MMFRRGQILWALWEAFAGPFQGDVPIQVPKTFVRRVTNLIELGAGLSPERRAGQKGIDQEYEIADAVELGIGLDLLDLGVPQAEAVSFLETVRGKLRRELNKLPVKASPNAEPVYLFLQPRRLTKTVARRAYDSNPFLAPEFVTGRKQLVAKLRNLRGTHLAAIIIEVQDLYWMLFEGLSQAPKIRRGHLAWSTRALNPAGHSSASSRP